MIIFLVVSFFAVNHDFFEFDWHYRSQGYEWKYVGETPAESGYPHLEVYNEDNEPVYYYQLFPGKEVHF